MLSVAREKPITLHEAADRLRVSLRTIQRWTRGIGGRRLETFRCGRVIRTSWEAIDRFQREQSESSFDPAEAQNRRVEAALEERHGLGFEKR